MKKLISLLTLLLTLPTANSAPFTPEELFSADEIQEIAISPNGQYIAYSMPADETDMVNIMELDSNKITYSFKMGTNKFAGNLTWANSERLLIQPAFKYGSYERKFYDGTLQAIDPDGGNNKKLYGYYGSFSMTKSIDTHHAFHIENLLASDKENILITTYKNSEATRKLLKLDVYTGHLRPFENSSVRKANFVTNEEGEVIAQTGITKDNDVIMSYLDADDEWVDIENTDNYDLLGTYKTSQLLMVKHTGKNQSKLIAMDRNTGNYSTLAEFDGIEINNLVLDNKSNIIGYVVYDGTPKTTFFDPSLPQAKLHKALTESFPNTHIRIIPTGKSSTKSIVIVSSDKEPGAYYLFDSKNNKLRLLSKNYKNLKRDQLAIMSPISFEARDGLTIPAYVTLPNDFKGNAPTVLVVHGGPFGIRDKWGFNREVQLLASHGYAVLQVNYRGSGDYGEEFQKAGYQQWGKAMQDDLTDATKWAIENGIADKERICIYGGSYGGYASLMGVVKEPDLYQCAIGYVGLYDLRLWTEVGDVRTRDEGMAYIKEAVGTDEKELEKYSPAAHVDKIKADLFLIHGEDDRRVPFAHYEALTEALDEIDYPYESLVKDGEGHGFASEENQIELYTRLLEFLDKNIGGKAN